MILKSNDIRKINTGLNKAILLYGKNDGFKAQITAQLIEGRKNIFNYDACLKLHEILKNFYYSKTIILINSNNQLYL